MSELEQLLNIQVLDSALDQVPHRSERLPERAAHRELVGRLASAEARVAGMSTRIETAEQRIGALEAEGAVRSTKKARLNQQLKTVIAPREAEALMAEIATIDREQSEADDEELELLDLLEATEAERSAAQAEVEALTVETAEAAAELARAEADLEGERVGLADQRSTAASMVNADRLARYERSRKSYGGVAISRLAAGRCGACHLDQSRAGLEAVMAAAADAEIECEQCGRLLVR